MDEPEGSASDRPGTSERFDSVDLLRDAHAELLRRAREGGDDPLFWDEVERFIRSGQASGVLFDSPADRRASQSLLDYWANRLYRAGRTAPSATLAEFDQAEAPALPDEPRPYRGLDAFGTDDAPFFFGRQSLVEEMVRRLQAEPLLAVIGPSGSGKSSVVMAGLVPALLGSALGHGESWRMLEPFVPGSFPLSRLAGLLRPPGVDGVDWVARQTENLMHDPSHLLQLVDESGESPVVLIVDQFEELFTLCRDQAVRQAFTDSLLTLIEAPGNAHRVIITVRSDFEPYVARFPAFHARYKDAVFHVPPLGAAELRQAIEGPARKVGLRFEEGLVEALLHDLLGEPAALPLLQFTLLRLWDRRQRNRVTLQAYHQVGGGRLALARAADELYESLIPELQTTARRILLRIALPSEGLEVTRQRVRRKVLFQIGEDPGRIQRVLDRLIDARLVRLTGGSTPDDAQVEIAHEALLRNWPRLVNWLEDEREVIRKRLRLTTAAEQWEASGRDVGALWGGAALDEALHYGDLSEVERQFVEASLANRDKEEADREAQRRHELEQARELAEAERKRAQDAEVHRQAQERYNRRLRWQRVIIGLVALLALVAFAFALVQLGHANQARNHAEQEGREAESLRLAAQSVNSLDTDPQLSLLLAVEATTVTPTLQAQNALHRALQNSQVRAILRGHTSGVRALAFSPDGSLLATAWGDGTIRVWEVATGDQVNVIDHELPVNLVVFSPDGGRLATGGEDGTVRVWSVRSAREPESQEAHRAGITSLIFSSDGQWLTSVDWLGSVAVWDLTTGDLFPVLEPEGYTSPVVVSSDGSKILRISSTGIMQLWNAGPEGHLSQARPPLAEAEPTISTATFDPRGRWLAAGADDGSVLLWDLATGEVRFELTDYQEPVTAVAFDTSGTSLATVYADGRVLVWSLRDLDETPLFLQGHVGSVSAVAFLPDGSGVAASGDDGALRLWNRATGEMETVLRGHEGTVNAFAFSPDGTLVATGDSAGTARLWAVTAEESQVILSGHPGGATALAFGPDGRVLATADGSGAVHLWDVAAIIDTWGVGVESVDLPSDTHMISDLAFSPDGQLLVAIGAAAHLWEVGDAAAMLDSEGSVVPESLDLTGIASPYGVAFDSHGRWLAVSGMSVDGKTSLVRVWNPSRERALVATLPAAAGYPWALAFSPDGSRLAMGVVDPIQSTGVIKIWDISQIQERGDDTSPVASLDIEKVSGSPALSPDWRMVAAPTSDRSILLWDLPQVLDTPGLEPQAVVLTGHDDTVLAVTFSPDGHLLVSRAADGTARLWDVQAALVTGGSGVEANVLAGHEGDVSDVAFDPGGHWLATGDEAGVVRLWALRIEDVQAVACSHAIRNLSLAEWREYFGHDAEYHQTCANLRVHPTVIEEYVRQGRVEAALTALRQARELDPAWDLNPEHEVARLLRQIAKEDVWRGDLDTARDRLAQASALDPSLGLVFEEEVARALIEQAVSGLTSYADRLAALTEAVELAPAVRHDAALSLLQFVTEGGPEVEIFDDEILAAMDQAVAWDPGVRTAAAEALVEILLDTDYPGRYTRRLDLLRQAAEWNPDYGPVLRVEEALVQAIQAGEAGRFNDAATALAKLPDPDQLSQAQTRRAADAYYVVCRQGLNQDMADQVVTVCERAIELSAQLRPVDFIGIMPVGWDEIWIEQAVCARWDAPGLSDTIAATCERLGQVAGPLPPGQPISNTLQMGQTHLWVFQGAGEQTATIEMAPGRGTLGALVSLIDPDARLVWYLDNRWVGAGTLHASLPMTGTYLVAVQEYSGSYTLTLRVAEE